MTARRVCNLSISIEIMVEKIKEIIENSLEDAIVHVMDPNNDGAHFQSVVISADFEGLSLVKQHQLVMNALKAEFDGPVHALMLKTFTPEKWESEKQNYNI